MARPGHPQQVSRSKNRGRADQARRRHLRHDERRRRSRSHHRVPALRNEHVAAVRRQHPRGDVGLPRPAGRPEEGSPAGPRPDLQELGPAGRCLPRPLPLAADRQPDRPDHRPGRTGRGPDLLPLPRSLHLQRHRPAGTRLRRPGRYRFPQLSRLLPVRQPVSLRNLDRSQDAEEPLRGRHPAGHRGNGRRSQTDPPQARTGPRRSPYNYVIHTAPFDHKDLPHYTWHLEIFPRLAGVAGFEWGSGFYINPVAPEEAAKFLREVEVDLD